MFPSLTPQFECYYFNMQFYSSHMFYFVFFFFFFQAEDGIRDLTVTGVQTCALPICRQELHLVPLDLRADRVGQAFLHRDDAPRVRKAVEQRVDPADVVEQKKRDRKSVV